MTDEFAAHIERRLASLPEPTRGLLGSAIASEAPDPWIRDVLLVYLRYFIRLFDFDEPADAAESALADALTDLAGLPRSGGAEPDIDAAEVVLRGGFTQRGYQFLGGRTPPHFGAYIWRRTEDRGFSVTLPRGEPQPVTVHFMHEFVLRGWLHWKTGGAQGAGGWYQQDDPSWPDGLYCVADRYPEPLEENRTFQVSLLGHEAQHVADHRAHPGLSSAELEYRAKLVELIGYDSVDERLTAFLADARAEPSEPHPYAAHLITERLAGRLFDTPAADADWESVSYPEIAAAAQALLDEDTDRLAASR
ncbi:MAG TPA: hypothetical protein VFP30_01050 [Candidatus Limnocylindria bacterium]|nr:hypothetical protein [Candidatus Limnocylindria bacterium]